MQLPNSSHFIYIPVVTMLGVALGFVLGSRATRDAIAQEQKKEAERLARKAARDARHAERAQQTPQKDPAGADEPPAKS